MTNDRRPERYFHVLSRWGTPEELEKLLRWATPDDLREIEKAFGTPEKTAELIILLKQRAEDWAWASTLKRKSSTSAKLIILVGAVVAILRPLALHLLELWKG